MASFLPQIRIRSDWRRGLRPSLLALALLVMAAVLFWPGKPPLAQSDQSVLAGLISRVLSTPTTQVSIGAIEGALSSDATIRDVRISDRDGVWLEVDRASIVWSRLALLRGRLEINRLEIGRLAYHRPARTTETEAAQVSDEPILPTLPVEVIVEAFSLQELALGEPVLGTAATLSARGSTRLGDPKQGLRLDFAAERRDAPGRLAVRLDYRPEANTLALDLTHDEPAGGLAARLLDLPGLPPVRLAVQGSGPLTAFNARLDFNAGETIGAQGQATVRRVDAAYQANLDLGARIAGLLPPAVAPIFGGTTRLTGDVSYGDDGRASLRSIRVTSQVATLGVTGQVAGDGGLDLTVDARALPTEGNRTRAGQAEIERLALDARVQGSLTAPRVNGTLRAAGLRLPQGTLSSLNAEVSMVPEGAGPDPDTFRFDIDADARGLALADAPIARAVGDRVEIRARGLLGTDGVARVDEARVATPTARASFAGRIGSHVLDGRAQAEIPALAPFSGLAGQRLTGSARLAATLTGDPGRSRVDADLDGRLADFAAATPALNGLLGRSVAISGRASRIPDGFSLTRLHLDGANLDVTLDGRATTAEANVTLDGTIAELRRLDPRIGAGRAVVAARLTGSLDRPDARATLTLADVRALDRSIPRLVVELEGTDLTGAIDASLRLDGEVAGNKAAGTAHLRRQDDSYQLDRLDVAVGSVSLRGNLRLGADGLAAGTLDLDGRDLDDLSPLVLTRLAGRARANVVLTVRDGQQDARIEASGGRLRFGETTLDDFTARVTAASLYTRPSLDGTVTADTIVVGGQRVRSVRLTATGSPQASDLTLSAQAQGFDLAAAGRLEPGDDRTRFTLASFSARRGNRRIALASPATIDVAGRTVRIGDLVLGVEGGRVAVSGSVGDALDLDVTVDRLPLVAADIFVPGLGLSGTLSGSADLAGTLAAPTGPFRLTLTRLAVPQLRQAGLTSLDVNASGRFADGRAILEAAVDAPRAGRLRVTGSVPLSATGALDLAVNGRVDLAVANTALSTSGQRVTGTANLDVTIRGLATDPDVQGTADIAGATFADPLNGVQLSAITGRLSARGDTVTVDRLTAATPNGGTLSASGRVTIDPNAGFPADLRLVGNRAQLASNATATAVADLDLAVSGPLLRSPAIRGRIDLVTLDVTVPDRLPTTLQPLPGTRHVRPTRTAAARLALERRRGQARSGGPPFTARLDLTVNALNRIFVRGRGINAELGGALRLTGTSRDPVAIGAFDLRRGRLDILGERLDFTRGRLDFTGDLTPSLDLVAETQAADVTARIAVTGPASAPEFAFSSTPDLPQDEILSRILFDKASGGLSAGQAVQLASALAQFSGGSGTGVFEDLRRGLGVDSLDITAGAGGPAVGVSRYISDNVRVGVRAGARPEDSGVTVDVDLTRRLRAQGEVSADGDTSVGIGFELEY